MVKVVNDYRLRCERCGIDKGPPPGQDLTPQLY